MNGTAPDPRQLHEHAPPPQHQLQVWGPAPHHHQQPFAPRPQPQPVASLPVEPQAVVSLVLGGTSLLLCWFPGISLVGFTGAVAAVVTGIVALRRLRTGVGSGRALAITGLSCGSAAAVVAGVASALFLAYVALFGGLWTMAWGTALSS